MANQNEAYQNIGAALGLIADGLSAVKGVANDLANKSQDDIDTVLNGFDQVLDMALLQYKIGVYQLVGRDYKVD